MAGRGHEVIFKDRHGIEWGTSKIILEYSPQPKNHYERRTTVTNIDLNILAATIRNDKPIKRTPSQNPYLGDYYVDEHSILWVFAHSEYSQNANWHLIPRIATVQDLYDNTVTWENGHCYNCGRDVTELHRCGAKGYI